MKISTIVVTVGLVFAAGSAFAFHCPKEMKAIDAALPGAKLSPEQLAEVKTLRAEGEALHKEKKHEEAIATLTKAKKILGI